jgi:uncharacterized membrane protein
MSASFQTRGTVAVALSAALAVLVLVAGLDARRRRAQRAGQQVQIALVASRLPFADLALSGGSRWLRAPSVEEPMGAFADGPGVPDPDPAGAFLSPGATQ